MTIYEYERPDGRVLERAFPFGKAPAAVTDEDGAVATRLYSPPSFGWREGQESESFLASRNESRTRDNLAAGDRGRASWRERMPKLRLG